MKLIHLGVLTLFCFSGVALGFDMPKTPDAPKAPSMGKADPNAAKALDVFVLKAKAASKLMHDSEQELFKIVASNDEMNKIEAKLKEADAEKDIKEKESKRNDAYKARAELLNDKLKDGDEMKKLGSLSAEKKTALRGVLFNLGLAVLIDKDLVESGQKVVSSAGSDPSLLAKIGNVKDAISDTKDQLESGGGLVSGVTKLATANSVTVEMPKSAKAKAVAYHGGSAAKKGKKPE